MTMMLPEADQRAQTKTGGGNRPAVAHIIRVDGSKNAEHNHAEAAITEAIVKGRTLTALCGYTWTPAFDVAGLPVCPTCRQILENMA